MNKVQEYYAYLGLAQSFSFASITIPLPWPQGDPRPFLPVKLFNVKTNQPAVNIKMLVDTGAANTIIGGQHAKPLGIDNLKKSNVSAEMAGVGQKSTAYQHNIKIQIGNLTPITVPVFVRDHTSEDNFLGWQGLLEKAKLEVLSSVEKKQFRYTEQAVAALGSAQSHFRSRI